ncbi:MAG: hypothetical protein MI922_02205 [Bacteroidales bacterium]|nr:hypothetical protein [Bacteroidales bacterium]
MKTSLKLLFTLTAVSFLVWSCVPSLHPLYFEKDLIFDETILGAWESDQEVTWNFEKYIPKKKDIESKSYVLTIHDEEDAVFDFHLLKLGDYIFADFYLEKYDIKNDMADMHCFPVHTFARYKHMGDSIIIEHFDFEFIENLIKENKVKIKHERPNDALILTAGTKELQKFVKKYAYDEDLYDTDNPTVLKRKTIPHNVH